MLKELSIYIDLEQRVYPSFQLLLEWFVEQGYSRVPLVLSQGDFAVRGGIIDVFPGNQSHPIRFDYDGDVLDRLCSFNLHTQCSLSTLSHTEIRSFDSDDPFLSSFSQNNAVDILVDYDRGDYVVHEDYGIGVFSGLVRRIVSGFEGEYVKLDFHGKDRVYVPLHHVDRIHPYVGGSLSPRLNRLNDGV